MNNFDYYAPTEVVFGKGTEHRAGELAKHYGAGRALLVYGGGSAVRSGLIGNIEASLKAKGIDFEEFGGAKANPTLTHAQEGVRKAVDFAADFILAVGGGSAIDTAKAIAHGASNPDADLWEIWTQKVPLEHSLPVGAVLTIAVAGSEMSDSAVLTNEALGRKKGLSNRLNRCRFAIMDPELAFTLPKYQLACGIADIMMHTMERYFISGISCQITDEIAEGLLRTVVDNGGRVMQNPEDYDAMAEVMWCSSLSHNGLTELGRGKDFSVHKFGQALSAKYDVTHGASLTACWGSWARFQYRDCPDRFARFARQIWHIQEEEDLTAARFGIEATEQYFHEVLQLPISVKELMGRSLSADEIRILSMDVTMNDTLRLSRIRPIGEKEAEEIYRMANV
ncbi:MAG: iron-containing alcohol dehydrogenase [Bilifractor sp.]